LIQSIVKTSCFGKPWGDNNVNIVDVSTIRSLYNYIYIYMYMYIHIYIYLSMLFVEVIYRRGARCIRWG
jgi:hypothetical protein